MKRTVTSANLQCVLFALLAITPGSHISLTAQEQKPENKELPKLLVAIPLGISAGQPAKLTFRGLKLENVSELRFGPGKLLATILNKGAANVPNQQDAERVGNTQLEVEITLPAEGTPETIEVLAVNPAGESMPYLLTINGGGGIPRIEDKEPNDGFAQAQPIALPQLIEGSISQPLNVDVFRIEGQAGQKLLADIWASRQGSALDPLLTLYDSRFKVLATNDDMPGSFDSRLQVVLPASGAYFLSVLDAHDQGGPAHVYRLSVTLGQ